MSGGLGSCVICCCALLPEKVSALPCGHTFHYDCVLKWVQEHKTCPNCRVRCIERNVIKNLFFNVDGDTTIAEDEDELEAKKKELYEKSQECAAMEKKLKSALSEAAVNLKERVRWQKKAEEGTEAVRKVGQLQLMLVEQNEKEKEIKELRSKLKASKFYQLIVSGDSEEKLNKYIKSDGEVDTGHFLQVLKKQLKDANEKIGEEKKLREEAEAKIGKYKRLAQGLKAKEGREDLVERLDHFTREKRISWGGEGSSVQEDFSDSFLGSAMRPAPKGKINIGGKPPQKQETHNTILDMESSVRRSLPESPEKDLFDVVMSKKVSARVTQPEKMSNGMGGQFSMKNSFDRLSTLPHKENRKPYDRVLPKKKVVTNNGRLSDWMKKKERNSVQVDLDSTICID